METETMVKEKNIGSSMETIPGRVYSYGCLVLKIRGFALDINENNLENYLEYPDEKELWLINKVKVSSDLSSKNYLDKK